MYKVEGTTIYLTRGDTLRIIVGLNNKDKTPYIPAENDSIRFALKSSRMNAQKTEFLDKEPLLIKNVPMDTMELKLDPEDTKKLSFGTYKYDL